MVFLSPPLGLVVLVWLVYRGLAPPAMRCFAPSGLRCFFVLIPRALPWAVLFSPLWGFGILVFKQDPPLDSLGRDDRGA